MRESKREKERESVGKLDKRKNSVGNVTNMYNKEVKRNKNYFNSS